MAVVMEVSFSDCVSVVDDSSPSVDKRLERILFAIRRSEKGLFGGRRFKGFE